MVPVARRNVLAEKGRLVMSVAGVAFRTSSLLPGDRLDELRQIAGVQAVLPVYARRIGFTLTDLPQRELPRVRQQYVGLV